MDRFLIAWRGPTAVRQMRAPRLSRSKTIFLASLLLAATLTATAAQDEVRALDGLESIRIDVQVSDPAGALGAGAPGILEDAVASFLGGEGRSLARLVRPEATDVLEVAVDVQPASFAGRSMGLHGSARASLYRNGVLRRTKAPVRAVVWHQGQGFYVPETEDGPELVRAVIGRLLRSFEDLVLKSGGGDSPTPAPAAGTGEGLDPDPCEEVEPGKFQFDLQMRTPGSMADLRQIDLDRAARALMARIDPEAADRIHPRGDDRFEITAECAEIVMRDVRRGIMGTVRAHYLEPVILNEGRACVLGVVWMDGRGFFAVNADDAERALVEGTGALVRAWCAQAIAD